jgi:hypothetical protein
VVEPVKSMPKQKSKVARKVKSDRDTSGTMNT